MRSLSEGTKEVSSNIAGVTQAAADSGDAAKQMLEASGDLSKQSEVLRETGPVDIEQFFGSWLN